MVQLLRYSAYILFFMILAGDVHWQSLLGAGLALVLCRPLLKTAGHDRPPLPLGRLPRLAGLWLCFAAVLLREVLVSNLQVAAIVLSPRPDISPRLTQYETALRAPFLVTALCTAITLTPGTMTVDVEGDTLKIHCLTDRHAETLRENPLEPVLLRIQEVLYG